MRRPVGLDLNGWRDFGYRDWSAEDPDAPPGALVSIDGGIRSVIVEHGDLRVGGPQAILAPIGRGKGWSDIGDPSKRRHLADHWSALIAGAPEGCFDGDLRAAANALSRQADQIIMCIPDHRAMGEAQQKRLLAALSGPRAPRPMLLWRSVALVLGLLDGGSLPEAADGMRVVCLIHGPDGIERQVLVLRQLAEYPGVLAPERDGPGEVCCPELGLTRLLAHASAIVETVNPVLLKQPTETPRMAADLLFHASPLWSEEIIRRDNSNWLKLTTPMNFTLAEATTENPTLSVEADYVLLLSPLAARHRGWLTGVLGGDANGRHPVIAAPDAAARGALHAARRIERGIPHYLDRLDQVSLVVMRGGEPTFEDLIPANAMVPGDREYVSPPIRSMAWEPGMEQAQFYIRKGAAEIRSFVARVETAPESREPLEIFLRQMPAQGWATLSVASTTWEMLRRAPIRLDWDAMEIDPRSEADILAALQGPRPAVPRRVRYPAHIGLWDGSLRAPGLRAALSRFRPGDPAALEMLRTAITAPHMAGSLGLFYPISTDGELPEELDDSTSERLTNVIGRVSDDLLRVIEDPFARFSNNDALRCLTWIFAACPPKVQRAVVAAFDAAVAFRGHPLLAPAGGRTVVIHGLGRIVADKVTIQALLPLLFDNLRRPDFLAPLAAILSRPAATPEILAGMDVETLSARLSPVLRGQHDEGLFDRDYKYALLAVGGLLRVREYIPWALTCARSPAAKALAAELRTAAERLRQVVNHIKGGPGKLAATEMLIEYLETNAGRPDLLTVIEGSDG